MAIDENDAHKIWQSLQILVNNFHKIHKEPSNMKIQSHFAAKVDIQIMEEMIQNFEKQFNDFALSKKDEDRSNSINSAIAKLKNKLEEIEPLHKNGKYKCY